MLRQRLQAWAEDTICPNRYLTGPSQPPHRPVSLNRGKPWGAEDPSVMTVNPPLKAPKTGSVRSIISISTPLDNAQATHLSAEGKVRRKPGGRGGPRGAPLRPRPAIPRLGGGHRPLIARYVTQEGADPIRQPASEEDGRLGSPPTPQPRLGNLTRVYRKVARILHGAGSSPDLGGLPPPWEQVLHRLSSGPAPPWNRVFPAYAEA